MHENIKNNSFNLNIKKSVLDDIAYRVKKSRIISDYGNEEWKYGRNQTG